MTTLFPTISRRPKQYARGDLVLTPDGARTWRLVYPFAYRGSLETFVVPAGFVTDFASVPRLFWVLFPPYGKYTRAAVLHDFLCDTRPINSIDAHRLFLRVMLEGGERVGRAVLMYLAVRWFGPRWKLSP